MVEHMQGLVQMQEEEHMVEQEVFQMVEHMQGLVQMQAEEHL